MHVLFESFKRRGCAPGYVMVSCFQKGGSELFANKSNLCCSKLAGCLPEQRFPLKKHGAPVLITSVRPRGLIMGLAAGFSYPSSNIAGRQWKIEPYYRGRISAQFVCAKTRGKSIWFIDVFTVHLKAFKHKGCLMLTEQYPCPSQPTAIWKHFQYLPVLPHGQDHNSVRAFTL